MKGILFLSGIFFFLCACTEKNPNAFTLEGTIDGMEGEPIYLMYSTDGNGQQSDTAVISGGKFSFRGEINIPMSMGCLLVGEMPRPQYCQVFLEAGKMTAAIEAEKFSEAKLTGSRTQAEWDSLMLQRSSLNRQIQEIYRRAQAEPDADKSEAIKAEADPLQEQVGALLRNFIHTRPRSLLTPYLLRSEMGRMSYAEIKTAYDHIPEQVKRFDSNVKEIEDELAVLVHVQPGQMAPEIKKADVNGKLVSLSALKGKYVLLDFWASWCVPCRKSFPHVKALYEKYHPKGFEVFCVADNDGTEANWKKAIEQDCVGMFIHVLRGLKKDANDPRKYDTRTDVSKAYAVHFLPTKYLIDPEGRIIGKFNDDELEVKLKEIFGE